MRQTLQKTSNLLLLQLQLLVQHHPHGEEETVDDVASLHLNVVGVACEVARRCELSSQLLAPFSEDAEDSWMLDR